MKAWRMRGCLIKFLNSLSLRKKKNTNYNQPKLFEMPNKNTLLGFHTVLFIPPFLSCSPCKNSECFSFYSDFPCFFLPPLLLCHLIMGTEAWSKKKDPSGSLSHGSLINLCAPSFCQELCPLLLSICCTSPFFLASELLRFLSPTKYLSFRYDPPVVIISLKKHALALQVM